MTSPKPGATSAAGFRDHFSRDAVSYARFRPRYPEALFEWLEGLPARRELAWDCATGNGQAAVQLARRFRQVIGTDASRAQLREVTRAPNLAYCASLAAASGVAGGRVDLITVAQAFHWLDPLPFWDEVARVAAPGAALAVWGYGRLCLSPDLDPLIRHFHDATMGPYWSPERRLVEAGYHGIPMPIEEQTPPPLEITAELSLDELLGYLRTWSAVGRCLAQTGQDPVAPFTAELAPVWGPPNQRRHASWPLFVRAGRWRDQSARPR